MFHHEFGLKKPTSSNQTKEFSEGVFRKAFMAYANATVASTAFMLSIWEKVRKDMKCHLSKQIFQKIVSSIQNSPDEWLSYNDAYYFVLVGLPVTLEPYVSRKIYQVW